MTPSGTLAEVAQQITALRERLDLVWSAHEREHKQHDESHAREHQFTADAIRVAAELAKENKRDSNEWRAAMDDRERTFATKVDIGSIAEKIVNLERAEIKRAEQERQRANEDAEHRQDAERRQSRSQWTVGLIVGLLATFGAILVNTVIRLSSGG